MTLINPTLRYFEGLTEGADQIFFGYDIATQKFSFLNVAFEKIWRKTRKSVLENPAALLKSIHPEDKQHVQQIYRELLGGAIIKDFEFRILLRDKTERWICVKPRLLGEDLVLVGSADDITPQKQYNDTLKKYSDKKNSILNILSHDLAGPLGLIHNLSSMLEEDMGANGNEEMHQIIGLIEKSSRQGMQLIQEFIKQEFLESASVELIRRRVDLVQATREVMESYQDTQQLTGKTFHFLPASEKLYLELDDTKFMQVINNLLSNAIKFTPDGGEITVTLEEKDDKVLIQVADTGIGIPEKYHNTLFDKFTRARRTGIKGEPSVGLGMSIIKTIVEWHQGKIWFESQENKGTTFFIEVPKTSF
jgi:two-component system, OmpR family, sensor histidine kinase VicK